MIVLKVLKVFIVVMVGWSDGRMAVIVVVMMVVMVAKRAVDVRDPAVEVFVRLADHSPRDKHPHVAKENGKGIGIAFLRHGFDRNEEAANGGKRRRGARGGGHCKHFGIAHHDLTVAENLS